MGKHRDTADQQHTDDTVTFDTYYEPPRLMELGSFADLTAGLVQGGRIDLGGKFSTPCR